MSFRQDEIVTLAQHFGLDRPLRAYLVHEPSNPHDPGAIAVWIDRFKVGYVPAGPEFLAVRRRLRAQLREQPVPTCWANFFLPLQQKPYVGIRLLLQREAGDCHPSAGLVTFPPLPGTRQVVTTKAQDAVNQIAELVQGRTRCHVVLQPSLIEDAISLEMRGLVLGQMWRGGSRSRVSALHELSAVGVMPTCIGTVEVVKGKPTLSVSLHPMEALDPDGFLDGRVVGVGPARALQSGRRHV